MIREAGGAATGAAVRATEAGGNPRRVALLACPDYGEPALTAALTRGLDLAVPAWRGLLRPGARVLLKPNLLSGAPPEKRITTDPALVRAVGRVVREAGCRLMIGDSPALEGLGRVARKSGLGAVAEELDAELVEFAPPVKAPTPPGAVFHDLRLAAPLMEADLVINLPKLKTHGQMLLTLGVKNLFGGVVAQRKAEWHHMAGVDRDTFAALLLDLYLTVRPGLTILDGVWGMHKFGPRNGLPFPYGLLAVADDALALDLAVGDLLGVPRSRFPLARVAQARGLAPALELLGDDPAGLRPRGMELPELDSLHLIPARLERLTRRFVVSRPVVRAERCAACGECLAICPEKAIGLGPRGAVIQNDRCIRCYCCQEVCPRDAIGFRQGLLARTLRLLGR